MSSQTTHNDPLLTRLQEDLETLDSQLDDLVSRARSRRMVGNRRMTLIQRARQARARAANQLAVVKGRGEDASMEQVDELRRSLDRTRQAVGNAVRHPKS